MKLIFLFILICSSLLQGGEWQELRGCRYVPNDFNDGDSFHVEHRGTEYIFRLYSVDTPESDSQVPQRVTDQAAYFGVSEEASLNVGRYAKQATAQMLSRPFTVMTQFRNAMGRSQLDRHYAFITTADGRDLGEELVRNGLARSHGSSTEAPNMSAAENRSRYDALEASARKKKLGIFSPTPGRELRLGKSDPKESAPVPEKPQERKTQEPVSSAIVGPDFDFSRISTQGLPSAPEPVNEAKPAKQSPQEIQSDGLIDLNTATSKALQRLPGVGEKMAAAIIKARPFYSVKDLMEVPGIGSKKFGQIESLVEVK